MLRHTTAPGPANPEPAANPTRRLSRPNGRGTRDTHEIEDPYDLRFPDAWDGWQHAIPSTRSDRRELARRLLRQKEPRAVTHRTVAGSEARGERLADGRPDPAQGAHWDLDLLTPDDVCALLKVKKSWLYDAVEDGSIETIRLGKQLRFRPSAIVRYLEERATNGNGHRQS